MVVLELFHIKDKKNKFITVCSQNKIDDIIILAIMEPYLNASPMFPLPIQDTGSLL